MFWSIRVWGLYHAYLRGHLDRHHARKLQVVQLFLEPAEHVGVVVRGLRVLGLAGLLCDLLEPGQLGLAQLLAAEFAGDDVHGQLLVVLLIHLVHLVHRGDVLHERELVLLKLVGDLVHVDFGLVVLGLERGDALTLLFEEAQEALFLLLVEVHALELDDQVRELLAHLAEVLGADLAERGVGEVRNVLLSSGAVVEDLLGVRDVYLLCEFLHRGLLCGGEAFKFELFNGDFLFLLQHRGGRLLRQLHGGGGGGRVRVERQGGDEFLVFVHL